MNWMVCVLQLFCAYLVYAQESGDPSRPRGTPMKFKTPQLSDEEMHSHFMPALMECDACKAIAMKIWNTFDKFNSVHKKYKYNLPESEILDLEEKICKSDSFENFGLKLVDDKKRLTGPGMAVENKPGVMQGGGKWPTRMSSMCDTFIEKIGDTEIYEAYKKRKNSVEIFVTYLCNGPGVFGKCTKVKDEL